MAIIPGDTAIVAASNGQSDELVSVPRPRSRAGGSSAAGSASAVMTTAQRTAAAPGLAVRPSSPKPTVYAGDVDVADNDQYAQEIASGIEGSGVGTPTMFSPLFDGFLSVSPDENVNPSSTILPRLYRETYAFDPVVGAAIDLLSTLPLGDFTLTGLQDEKQLLKFASSVEAMRIPQLLPAASLDYLTLGRFLATARFNQAEKIYDAINPHNPDWASYEISPTYGEDPIITLSLPKEVLKVLNDSSNPLYARFKDKLAPELLSGNASLVLPHDSTLFMARPGRTGDPLGVSIIRRCLMVLLMERALQRGTLDQFYKRQRAILHIMVGDGDEWRATTADMSSIGRLFASADRDPVGAIVVTRHGIDVSEIRRGDDMFKWSDFYDFATQAKLRAMGLSDSLFGADFSIGVAVDSLNLALKQLTYYRELVTREIFYEKLFPGIAQANGYVRKHGSSIVLSSADKSHRAEASRRQGVVYRREEEGDFAIEMGAASAPIVDTDAPSIRGSKRSSLAYPRVEWKVPLEATDYDRAMAKLDKLAENGMPIPLRTWAAASGLSVDSMLEQQKSDIALRKSLKKWRREVAKSKGDSDPMSMGGGDGGVSEEAASALIASLEGRGSVARRGPLSREFDVDNSTPRVSTGRGYRAASARERAAANNKANKYIATAAVELAKVKRSEDNEKHRNRTSKKYYIARHKPTK